MNDSFSTTTANGVCVVQSNLLLEHNVTHGFTTRIGGKSKPPLDTLNLGFNRPEPRHVIEENYMRVCDAFELDFESLVLVSYEHGTTVLPVSGADCGKGICQDIPPLPPCDGVVTNDPSVTLFTLHADCSAFFVYDPVHHAIGLAHAGWRGTLGRIGAKLIYCMSENYGTRAKDVVAVVSPCICGKCYEVGNDVADRFVMELDDPAIVLPHAAADKAYIDIRRAAQDVFLEAGVPPDNIGHIPCCTFENEELFYSYRRNGRGKTGAMGAFLKLK